MRTRTTLKRVMTGLIGCAVISALSAPIGSHLDLDIGGRDAVTALLENLLTPAPAMGQSAVQGRGKVISVVAEKQELVLEHGEIKGFMDAMTMGYKVKSPSLLKGVKAGDQVNFTIDKNNSVITKLTKLRVKN